MPRIILLLIASIGLNFLSVAQESTNIRNISLDSDRKFENLMESTSTEDSPELNSPIITEAKEQTLLISKENTLSNTIQINLVSLAFEFGEMMDGRIVIQASGGIPEYSYAWSHNIDLNSSTAENLSSGDYVVTVTDASGITASKEFFLGFITSTENFEMDNRISIYPNPSFDGIKIKSEGIERINEIRLINNIGQVLKSWESVPSDTWLELMNISAGNYFLNFIIEDKSIYKKLVIN